MLLKRVLDERSDPSLPPCIVVGLMSGTSLDGLDIAVVSLRGSGRSLQVVDILSFATAPLPEDEIRRPIQQLLQQAVGTVPLQLVCKLNTAWARFAAKEVNAMIDSLSLPAGTNICIGSHGQTLWHEGHNPPPRSTLQLGDGEVLAALTQRIVVSNFRAADVAVGGCGAPLVPYMDRVLAANVARWSSSSAAAATEDPHHHVVVAFQNLGGIGNVSCEYMSATGNMTLAAFDTGPANVILNELIETTYQVYRDDPIFVQHVWCLMPRSASQDQQQALCDWNGCFSSRGHVRQEWLRAWADEHRDYVHAPPPKSTGREVFGAAFVHKHCAPLLQRHSENLASIEDVQVFFDLCRTAVEFTAWTIAEAYEKHLPPFRRGGDSDLDAVVVLSGGGALNPFMVDCIRTLLLSTCLSGDDALDPPPPHDRRRITVTTMDALRNAAGGVAGSVSWSDAKEAVAFAILAHEKLNDIAGVFSPWAPEVGEVGTNVLSATGASRAVVLGQLSIPTTTTS